MLTCKLYIEDIDKEWVSVEKKLLFGQSMIEAFVSSQVIMSASDCDGQKEIWIGEDHDPFSSEEFSVIRTNNYRAFDEFEGIKLSLHATNGRANCDIVRTAAGTCPIYVSIFEGTLTLSWRFEDAVYALPRRRPNIESCRLYLEHGPTHTREQIIDGVRMLWPGESVTFDGSDLYFREVDTPDIVLPSILHDSARATDEFVRLIGDAVRRNLLKAANPLVELSGGFDSSCVAIAACAVRSGINSYGVIHEGPIGEQQRNRRRELVTLLGLHDFEFPSYTFPPFSALEADECTFTHFDDNYRLPCVNAVDNHPAKPIDLIITGIGGDELTKENTFRRRDWEVAGGICSSSITAAAGRADMFMRRGIWPVHPLLNQRVVDFCRALPKKMRSGRMLNILTLARRGLSDGFLFPRYPEHYGNIVLREASLLDFDKALSTSVVADHGVAEISKLLSSAREATLDGFSYELITELYFLVKLETILRRYLV